MEFMMGRPDRGPELLTSLKTELTKCLPPSVKGGAFRKVDVKLWNQNGQDELSVKVVGPIGKEHLEKIEATIAEFKPINQRITIDARLVLKGDVSD